MLTGHPDLGVAPTLENGLRSSALQQAGKVELAMRNLPADAGDIRDVGSRSPAQVGCMRQVLRPGALGRPRGIG